MVNKLTTLAADYTVLIRCGYKALITGAYKVLCSKMGLILHMRP